MRFQCQSTWGRHFNPTNGNESLHEISNDNGVGIVNFATFKNLTAKSTMFPHCNIHKSATSPDAKTHNQKDHILIDGSQHSGVLDVQSFRAAYCDTDPCLAVAKFRERAAVSKQTMHKFNMESFNLKKLNKVEGREQYYVENSNRLASLENLYDELNIKRAWETIRQTIKISAKESLGYYELKKHKLQFHKGRSKLLEQKKQAKQQWLQDPNQINGDNLKNTKRKTSRHFRNKKREYLTVKLSVCLTN
jgi:hypothetical protein